MAKRRTPAPTPCRPARMQRAHRVLVEAEARELWPPHYLTEQVKRGEVLLDADDVAYQAVARATYDVVCLDDDRRRLEMDLGGSAPSHNVLAQQELEVVGGRMSESKLQADHEYHLRQTIARYNATGQVPWSDPAHPDYFPPIA